MATKCQVDEAAFRLTRAVRWAHTYLPWEGDPTLGAPSREYERLRRLGGAELVAGVMRSLGFTLHLVNSHEVWAKEVTREEVAALRAGGFALSTDKFRDVVGVAAEAYHES
jgi:hypothetical protein